MARSRQILCTAAQYTLHRPRHFTLVGVILLAVFSGAAGAAEVQWRYDYNRARREAQDKGRPLLLDISTEHCFWCKKLDATTFRDPTVVQVLNEQFIPLKIDANRDGPLAEFLHVQA